MLFYRSILHKVFSFPFGQCFLNFNVHNSHPGILVKMQFQVMVGTRVSAFTSSQVMPVFLVWTMLLEEVFSCLSTILACMGCLTSITNKQKCSSYHPMIYDMEKTCVMIKFCSCVGCLGPLTFKMQVVAWFFALRGHLN